MMDLLDNPDIGHRFTSLGSQIGNSYVIAPECQSTLNEILNKLFVEDRILRTFRRAINVSQLIKKDLLPLLINVKDERKIVDITIKILANLTMPIECLLPIEIMSKTEAGRNTILELNWLLFSCKETFLDPRSTRRIIDHIITVMEKGDKMDSVDCESLNDSIMLLRNILHVPELRENTSGPLYQNQILWHLFAQNIDKVLIDLMSICYHGEWKLVMVQLLSLLYKDQQMHTLQNLLKMWYADAVLSESSEDNESNTSPPNEGLSDPTSDSSVNSEYEQKLYVKINELEVEPTIGEKERHCERKQLLNPDNIIKSEYHQSLNLLLTRTSFEEDQKMEVCPSELSDCGYGTQLENQESPSTSSNEDFTTNWLAKPNHNKPGNMLHKSRDPIGKPIVKKTVTHRREKLKKKKLTANVRTNMEILLQHKPTDEDISQLLKEFTIDFLLKGYSSLVSDLREQLLHNNQVKLVIDKSHFFWLVTYFLKFAVQLELDLEYISSVLSFKIISFLTFEGVGLCEQFELTKFQSECDLRPFIRRIHLVVTAIRELIQTINSYKNAKHLNSEDELQLNELQRQISETEELRCLFVLLLRQFDPTLHSIQYLEDVIVTNHLLLSFIESCSLSNSNVILQKHMKQFVTVDIMKKYGHLLECFQQNNEFVNDCVFTMMHHVAGDLENVSALFQPNILKTFNQMWESDFELCDDWSDLIEYVIHKFINMPRTVFILPETKAIINDSLISSKIQEWSKEECESLYWYYVQSANGRDPVGQIMKLYTESGITNKTRMGVIEQLLKQDVITHLQYNELMGKEPIDGSNQTSQIEVQANDPDKDEIEILKDYLIKENKFCYIAWVQRVILEACHAKLSLIKKSKLIIEPISYYYTLLQEPIPMVTWNCEQSSAMQSQLFVLLLHKLGLHLPADAGKVFARIPQSWSPDTLFSIASKLGPIKSDWIKFDLGELTNTTSFKELHKVSFTPGPVSNKSSPPRSNPSTSWYKNLEKMKI